MITSQRVDRFIDTLVEREKASNGAESSMDSAPFNICSFLRFFTSLRSE